MRASFCSLCPARLGFSLFFPAFSLAAGHHRLPFAPHAPPASDFLSSSLFFLWRRGTTALFLLPCPAQNNFSLFFPAFSLAAGHHRLPFAPCAPPASDFLSSSLFFSAGGAPQASFCSPCPARDALQPDLQPPFSQKQRRQSLSADFRFHVFHMPARSFRQNTVSKSSPSSIAS